MASTIANEQTLRDLVREFKATGPAYRQQLHTVMKSAYRSHYRAMLIRLLDSLQFHSNNETHRPVLDALAIVKQYAGSRLHTYPIEIPVPMESIVRGPWQEAEIARVCRALKGSSCSPRFDPWSIDFP